MSLRIAAVFEFLATQLHREKANFFGNGCCYQQCSDRENAKGKLVGDRLGITMVDTQAFEELIEAEVEQLRRTPRVARSSNTTLRPKFGCRSYGWRTGRKRRSREQIENVG